MESGLENLQTAGRTALRREADANLSDDLESDEVTGNRFSLSRRKRFRSDQDEEDGFNDSAIGTEQTTFVDDSAFALSRGNYWQAPYPTPQWRLYRTSNQRCFQASVLVLARQVA